MKKYLLKLLLFSCFLIFGFSSANAAFTYTNLTTPGSNGLAPSPVSVGSTQTAVPVYGVEITSSAAATAFTTIRFDLTSGNSWNTEITGNVSLYVMTAAQYAAATNSFSLATATLLQTLASPGTPNLTFNAFTGTNPAFTAGALTLYYFVVINYTNSVVAVPTTDQIEINRLTNGAGNTNPTTAVGATYVYNSAISVSAASTAGYTNPLPVSVTGIPLIGITVTNAGATAFPFGQFDLTANIAPSTYFANFKLYVNTTGNTFAGATTQVTATFNGTTGTTDINPTFTASIPANKSYTYFIVADYTYPAPATAKTFQFSVTDLQPASGTLSYTTGAFAGPVLNIPAVTYDSYSVASLGVTAGPTNGLVSNPIINTQTNIAIYGLQVTGAGANTTTAQTISALQFTESAASTYQNLSSYFANFRLYASTTPTFGGTGAGTSTLLSTVAAPATATISFTGLTQTVAYNSVLYYFVVVDYNTLVAASSTFELDFTKATATSTNVTAAATGFNYTLPILTITATSLNTSTNPTQPTAGLTANPIAATGTKLPIYGLQLAASATGQTKTITALNFTQAGGQNNNYYMANAYLYSSTSATYSAGTSTLLQTITGVGATTTLNFTGLNISVAAGQTLYYFVLIDYTTAVDATVTFQLNFTSATGATVAGTPAGYSYNFPVLTITATSLNTSTNPTQPTAGLVANPISATGTGLPIYGLQLAATGTAPAQVITALNFTQAGGQNNSYYMVNAYLYSSTSATYSAGTSTLVKTITGVGATTTLNFTGLTINVATGQTLYYFVLIDYNTAVTAAANFQLNFTSATSATVTGTPAGYQYNFTLLAFAATSLNTSTNPTQPTAGLTPNPIAALGTGLPVYGLQLAATTAGPAKTITALNFTQVGGQVNSYYIANAYLYSSTSPTYSAGTSTLVKTITGVPATTALNFTGLTIPVSTGQTLYYFVLVDYNTVTAAAANFQLNFTSATGATVTGTPAGYQYNFTSLTITATALGVTGGPTNGLTANPITALANGLPIYGMQLSASASGPTRTLTTLTFTSNSPQGNNNYYFSNAYLYSSTSSTFPGVGNAGATLVSTVATGASDIISFTGLSIPVAASSTLYYFVVVDYTAYIAAATATYQLNFTSAVGATIASGAGNTGFNYTVTSPTYTITSNASGIQAAATPYYYGSTGDALESFGVTSNGAIQLNTFTLTSTTAYTTYFSNLTIYSSSNPNYAADLAGTGSALTSVPFTVTGTTSLVVTLSTPQALSATPIYYFVVADFTTGDNLFTNTTTAINFQLNLTAASATFTSNSNTVAASNTFPVNSTTYQLLSPVALGASNGTGLATANQLNISQTQVGILGFSITTTQNETINQLHFGATIVPSTNEISAFFSNVTLYYNTTDNATTATAVPAGYVVSSLDGKTFNISGLSIAVNSTTLYFYIKADFTAPTNFSSTFQLGVVSCTVPGPLVCTAGASVNGTTYNISPTVTIGNATTTGLAANPIIATQNGATLALFSFSVYSGPALTFTTFNLTSTQPSGQYLGSNFSGYALYVNTTNTLTGATAVTGATFSPIASSNTLTISGLSQAIPAGKTYYYFIKAVFTSPAVATTYQLNLTSVATATNTYTTGGPINGIFYTLAGPLGVYYWEGDSGARANWNTWESAGNWLNANTGTTGNGYPGQSTNSDIAVFSIKYANTFIITAGTTKTISEVILNINNIYPYALELANGITFSVTSGLVLGDPGQVNTVPAPTNPYLSQLQLDEVNTNGTGIYYIGGTSYIYNDGSLAIDAHATFSASSILNLYGTAADPSFFGIFGGTVTANNVTWNLSGNGSEIYLDDANTGTSTLNATNSTINFTGFSSQLNSYGYPTFTGCTINSSSISDNQYLTGMGCQAGTFTITGSSLVNMGTASNNGNYNGLKCEGGTFNISGSTVVNLKGPSSFISNDYTKATQFNLTIKNPQAYFNINSSTINLGTVGNSDGLGANIYNTDAAFFNLNAGSVINMNGTNSEIENTSSANAAGTTGYGVFQAASTSVINPTSTTAIVYNMNGADYFTLLSDINGSATIGQLGAGAQVSGKYNVQRYLNGGATYLRNYRLLSSPTNTDNATSSGTNHIDLSYLGANTVIPYTTTTFYGAFIGGPGATFGGGIHTFTNPLMYLYQENIAPGTAYNQSFTSGKNVGIVSLDTLHNTLGTLNTASGYGSGSSTTSPSVPSTSISEPSYDNGTGVIVPPGNGYIMYYVGNSTNTAPTSATAPTASTVTATGYINQSQVQLYMWGSDSPNLTDTYGITGVRLPGITIVGNPYPSTIDLGMVWYDNANAITPSLYQLDKTNQQFDTYNASTHASSTSLSSEYVASGQGFYIKVDSLGTTKTFYFQEDQKTASTTAPFFPPISNFAVIHSPGQTVDNVNSVSSTGNGTTDSFAPQGASAAGNSTDASGTIAAPLTNNVLTNAVSNSNIGATQESNNVLLGDFRARAGEPALRKPPKSTIQPEAPQPAQSHGNTPVVNNPAGLHLKFVVDSVDYDEVGIFFNKAWSDKFDKYDSFDMDGQSSKVYLSSYTSDGVRTSINALGDYTGGKRVPLYVVADATGIYQIQMSDIENFDTKDYSVFLIDNMLKDSLDLTLYKSYNFNYTAGATAQYSTRFVLAIEHKPVPYYALLTFAGQKVTPGVQLNWQTKNEGNATTFVLQKLSANNVYVPIDSLQSDSSGEFSYIDQHPKLGNNTYRLQQTNELGVITYSAPVTIGYNSTSPNGDLTIYPNPSKAMITVTLNTSSIASDVASADIYNTSGKLVEHKAVSSNSFTHDISSYQLGVYIIELKNSNGVIVGESKFVKVE
jgi:hypothetical protein